MSLSSAEILLRLINVRYATAPLISDPILHHVHPKNYTYIVHDPKREYGRHRVRFDEDGFVADPEVSSISSSSPATCRIAFMGDSFTEALQVSYSESFVGKIALRDPQRLKVRNFGVSSYSPILYLLQWRQVVHAFKPTHVILLLYSNDIRDDREYQEGSRLNAAGEIEAVPGIAPGPFVEWLRHSYLFRYVRKLQREIEWRYHYQTVTAGVEIGGYLEENPDVSEPTTGFLRVLSQEIATAGARLVLTVVPSKFRLLKKLPKEAEPEFSDKWKVWAKKNGIDFLDLTQPFLEASLHGDKLFFDQDIHFTSTGHKVTAAAMLSSYPLLTHCLDHEPLIVGD